MKFMFVGNPTRRDDANSVTVFGITFPIRVPVEVTNPVAIAKLSANHHFVVIPDADAPAAAVAVEVEAPVIASAPILTDADGPRKARKAK